MLKKCLALLLCVSMLLTCFVFPGFAAVTGEEAAQVALADASLTLGDLAANASASTPAPLYDEKDELIGYLVYVSYDSGNISVPTQFPSWSLSYYDCIMYVIDTDGEILNSSMTYDYYVITVPEGGKLYYCNRYEEFWFCYPDGTLEDEYGYTCTRESMNETFEQARAADEAEREEAEMDGLIENTNSLSDIIKNFRTLGFEKFVKYLIALIKQLCAYVLDGWINFPSDWDKAQADECVDEALKAYCEENNCTVTETYRIDKDYFVPNRQTYFSDGEDVGSGVCGVASWEMILGGYRDKGIFPELPDDQTMYREIMAIMDDISDELQPIIQNFLKTNAPLIDDVINPVMIDTIGMYIDKDFEFNSYEVIGTLDIGIALYLNQYGYTEYARRVLSNVTISIPVLSEAKRTLFMRDVKNEISGWIYEKTDGKLNLPTACGSTAEDTVLRSLERGEPAIFGCWASLLGDNDLTNHYFVIASLFKVESEIKISDTKSVKIERNLVEVYDTWSNDSVELVDFDALCATTVSDANSLALLF